MREAGPPLEALTRRLAECPPDFLAEPRIGESGVIEVAAVVSDLLEDLDGPPLKPVDIPTFTTADPAQRNRLRAVLIACWLLHDRWFLDRRRCSPAAFSFLTADLPELANHVGAEKLVTDPDRREELARFCLKALDLRPAGESPEQAQDRLTTLSSVERARVIREARAAEERTRQIREAMRRKAAEEAAAKYSRE